MTSSVPGLSHTLVECCLALLLVKLLRYGTIFLYLKCHQINDSNFVCGLITREIYPIL